MGFHNSIFRTQLIKVFCALGANHVVSQTSLSDAQGPVEGITVVFIPLYHQ